VALCAVVVVCSFVGFSTSHHVRLGRKIEKKSKSKNNEQKLLRRINLVLLFDYISNRLYNNKELCGNKTFSFQSW